MPGRSRLPRANTPARRDALVAGLRALAAGLLKAAALAEAVAGELEAEPHAPTEAEWRDLGRPEAASRP